MRKFNLNSLVVVGCFLASVCFAAETELFSSDKISTVVKDFCASDGEGLSPVQKKLAILGQYGDQFGLTSFTTCISAVAYLSALGTDGAVLASIIETLNEKNFNKRAVQEILQAAFMKAAVIEASLAERTWGIGTVLSASGLVDTYEMIELVNLRQQIRDKGRSLEDGSAQAYVREILTTNFFDKLRARIDLAVKFVEDYPAEKLNLCIEVTDDLNLIGQCVTSKASLEVISRCTVRHGLVTDVLKCIIEVESRPK